MKAVAGGGRTVVWISEARGLLRETRQVALALAALLAVTAGLAIALAVAASAPEPRVYETR